jgi:nucleoside-diphosphate-sugar epimerase
MDEWPQVIRDERELDEVLSRPWPRLVDFLHGLEGDLLILGAGGKMGPTLARTARRAIRAAGVAKDVIAVGRRPMPDLEAEGVRTIACDLLDPEAVARLPRAANIIFMAGRKFGSTGDEPTTWAANVIVPYHVARTFTASRIASFSTGGVYPLVEVASGGATEQTPPDPIGEYAMSCLGRERMFDYFSRTAGEKVVHIRLNYAVELRYGVLVDVATRVWRGEPVDVAIGYANVIWQGDACNQALLALGLAASPAAPLNVTGPGMISIRETAERFGRLLGRPPVIAGQEGARAFLSSAAESHRLLGPPLVPLERVIAWTADWVRRGGRDLGKPTHFEVRDGRY